MKKHVPCLAAAYLLGALVVAWPLAADESYTLSFSTYLGGTAWEHARGARVSF
jgi:hypothetical protein